MSSNRLQIAKGLPRYLKGIVIPIGSQMLMRSKLQVDIYSLLEVLQFHRDLVNKQF
jgi:hypothetical protein